MATDVKVPALGESITEGTLAQWLKKAGEAVEIEFVRGRGTRKVTVTLDERKGRERTIDLGEMGDRLRRHAWVWKDGDNLDVRIPRFKVEHLDELPNLRDRLEELEKRMKELEKKLAR